MRTTRIKIKNLFGIRETELSGASVELTGRNGTGKTSVLDAIRYALTNKSDREYIIRSGESEGEILIETDTGLSIDRKKRTDRADYKMIREGNNEVRSPEAFLQEIFTPLQLDPVRFTTLSAREQNKMLLDLIKFDWDLDWIRSKFGEIPTGVNYDQNILSVLDEIQSENGDYFRRRQDINREIRNKRAFVEEIAATIPQGYNAEKWRTYDLVGKCDELSRLREENGKIERAKLFFDSFENKKRGLLADAELKKTEYDRSQERRREDMRRQIASFREQIAAMEAEISGMDAARAGKHEAIEAEYREKLSALKIEMQSVGDLAEKEPHDTSTLDAEIASAKDMIRHLNEYDRMCEMSDRVERLQAESDALTDKIELARSLPAEILREAEIPVENLTVRDGMPLINGLPVSNLSEGEKMRLCVDIAVSRPGGLRIILLDGTEKLSEENRTALYDLCREKGLQFIATRTTEGDEMEVTAL